jgi:hypothetical protein
MAERAGPVKLVKRRQAASGAQTSDAGGPFVLVAIKNHGDACRRILAKLS